MSAIVRVLWFLVIGWWLGPLWFVLSMALMLSVIFFPIGAYTATKTWHVMTFKTSPSTVIVEARD
jgi:uncharacterized membrane protein YccF (DUF307 family)